MAKKMLVADLLCGAGGSSTGCARALAELGLKMELVCVNHWPVALDTHSKNHPEARHYCQDIATVRPHLIVPEGYLDLLMASPTCTHHSVARGGKPTSDQQRSDPWHIVTWLTELRVKRMIIENVWEFTGWGPVDARTGRPIQSRKGEYFRAWIDTIRRLGYDPEWRKLNAADFGDATTRQRFILMARSDKRSVSWPIPTHRKKIADELLLFPSMKPWRPARDIIDWNIKGNSIFNRKKPLAPKTLARIMVGAVKFGWPEPFLVILRNHMAGQSVDGPVPTIAANGNHIGLAQPVIIATAHGNEAHERDPNNRRVKSPDEPLGAIHASGGNFAVAEPIIVNGRKGNKAKGVSIDPVPTLDTKGGVWLAEPFMLSTQNSGAPRSAEEPLSTITTGGAGVEKRQGCARPMLVEPFILNRHGEGYGETRAHSLEEPTPTANCRGAGYLIEPFVLSRQGEGAPRSIEEPTPSQVAKHSHVLISPYYGTGSGETCNSAEEPLPTVTSKARFGMVVPITHADGSNRARNADTDPLPTLTTANRGEQALIEGTATYDILFRMLEPHELAAAMGFDSEEATYEFAGTKTEKIKQIGNAVSVSKMKACVGALMADAAPKRKPVEAPAAEKAASA
jgi:DNA (cytosine-5)-methyltransferase 1